jgi:multicomponent K+:H+ antiporter subunit G
MNHLAEVPLWAAIPIALLTVVGSSLALIGSYGLARLRTFYERLHPPTLGATWGTGAVVLASMALFSVLGSRLVVHEALIAFFVLITAPVTLMLLGRAAFHRDEAKDRQPHPTSEAAPDAPGKIPANPQDAP